VQPNIVKGIVELVRQRGLEEFDNAPAEKALLPQGESLSNEELGELVEERVLRHTIMQVLTTLYFAQSDHCRFKGWYDQDGRGRIACRE
jgi:hypothetical protein